MLPGFAALGFTAALFAAPTRNASVSLAPRVSLEVVTALPGAGLEMRLRLAELGETFTLSLRPSFDYLRGSTSYWKDDRTTLLNFAGDLLLEASVAGPLGLYGLVGFNALYYETDNDGGGIADLLLGANLGVGVRVALTDLLHPFVEVRSTLLSGPILGTAGLLFAF